MDIDYLPLLVDATPDDILAVLRDLHWHQCWDDPNANPESTLSPDSTIDQWRDDCGLQPWKQLAEGMNNLWSVDIPLPEWKRVLKPSKERKLRDVCELLARHAKVPRVRPIEIAGSYSTAAAHAAS
jgi:hypothetical protein